MTHLSPPKSATVAAKQPPWRSTVALVVFVALLLAVSSVSSSRCAFGFGGFQCEGLPAGSGSLLMTATLALLVLAAGAAVWAVIGWARWLLATRRRR